MRMYKHSNLKDFQHQQKASVWLFFLIQNTVFNTILCQTESCILQKRLVVLSVKPAILIRPVMGIR